MRQRGRHHRDLGPRSQMPIEVEYPADGAHGVLLKDARSRAESSEGSASFTGAGVLRGPPRKVRTKLFAIAMRFQDLDLEQLFLSSALRMRHCRNTDCGRRAALDRLYFAANGRSID
jgi:hypothetical protein